MGPAAHDRNGFEQIGDLGPLLLVWNDNGIWTGCRQVLVDRELIGGILVDNHKSARLRGAGESRDLWLQMLIPGVLLGVLLIVLVGFVPREVFVPSIVVVGVGLLTSGAVGVFTGIRGPRGSFTL